MVDTPAVVAPSGQAPTITPVATPTVAAPVAQATVTSVEAPSGPGNTVKLEDTPAVQTSDWLAALSPENKAAVEKSGWKDVNEVVKSYNELRTLAQSKGFEDLPTGATPEQKAAWNKARGAPDLAADYNLTMPAEMPKNMPYDATFAENFKSWSHELGLTKTQADALHSKYVGVMANNFTQSSQAVIENATKTHTELSKAWGEPGTPDYNKNVELATRAMRHLDPGLSDALKQVGLIDNSGVVLSAPIAKALANAGQKLYAEDIMYGSGVSEIKNPWARGNENLTEQGKIFTADPERARRLAAAAGANVTF